MCEKKITRNRIRCCGCNTILESKHRHDFRDCRCDLGTFVDGGIAYVRVGSKDLSMVEFLTEYDKDCDCDEPRGEQDCGA